VVTHDIGNMVGYAFAAQHPKRVTRLRVDRRPGARRRPVGGDPQEPAAVALPVRRPRHGALVAGRERIYLDRFWNEFSANRPVSPKPRASTTPRSTPCRAPCTAASRSSRPSTRTPSTTRPSWPSGKLTMPVLALGGEKSFGPMMATVMRFAASNVTEGVVPDSGHWIMEENPKATVAWCAASWTPSHDRPLVRARRPADGDRLLASAPSWPKTELRLTPPRSTPWPRAARARDLPASPASDHGPLRRSDQGRALYDRDPRAAQHPHRRPRPSRQPHGRRGLREPGTSATAARRTRRWSRPCRRAASTPSRPASITSP
jgi:hypothetical protein